MGCVLSVERSLLKIGDIIVWGRGAGLVGGEGGGDVLYSFYGKFNDKSLVISCVYT